MAEILIAGCGFLGEAAAVLFSGNGWKVHALSASESSAENLRQCGWSAYSGNLAELASVAALRRSIGPVDVVVHCASSGRGGEEAYRRVYAQGMRNLDAMFPEAQLLFVSSTSVYGQTDGELVDELSVAAPTRETSRILLAAEQLALRTGGWVVRVAGLYGPERSVYLRKFQAGEAVLENGGTRWVNQVHRDDAAMALFHLVKSGAASGIYNVCDDTPASLKQIYTWLAEALSGPLPPDGTADPNRKRALTHKRVSNAKLREIGWQPKYPSYREAIPDLL